MNAYDEAEGMSRADAATALLAVIHSETECLYPGERVRVRSHVLPFVIGLLTNASEVNDVTVSILRNYVRNETRLLISGDRDAQ